MWKQIAIWTLKNRLKVLLVLGLLTLVMGYFATKVQLSYEPIMAIPQSSQKLKDYNNFRQLFGEDGNLIVLAFDGKGIKDPVFFNNFSKFCKDLKQIDGVENVLAMPTAVGLQKLKTDTSESLTAKNIFSSNQSLFAAELDSFFNLPFYQGFLYNTQNLTQLIAVRINKDIIRSPKRVLLVSDIQTLGTQFETANHVSLKYSGLPLIRSLIGVKIQNEMKLFLLASLLLTSIILFLFFRNIISVLFSILIVLAGVVWSSGLMVLFGFKLTMLSALIPPLIVVICIPNCIYFLNKYHQEYNRTGNQAKSLVLMVQKMGIVTLFTNLTAAIGFGVFCFTSSALLSQFGWVAWVSIIIVFFISLFAIPAIFSYLPAPDVKHTNYLDSKLLNKWLSKIEHWVFNKRVVVYAIWGLIVLVTGLGIGKLKSNGFMVDDLPKQDKIYTDLQYFESNFKGIMPLDIWINTKRKGGATSLNTLNKIDELGTEISGLPQLAKPISIVEAVKFARQAYYDGDSTSYAMPTSFDAAFIAPYLKGNMQKNKNAKKQSQMDDLMKSFVDATKQHTRLSINMKDVGSHELPKILNAVNKSVLNIFDSNKYEIKYTGASVVFLEGNKFIINSLTESIIYAFLMILFCMVFLFRDWRIVLMSIAANIIPLIITAGVMGWLGIPLKPSTVLVFSVALGITIDVTIRFLVAFKQELPLNNYDIKNTVRATIYDTGFSIIYTSLILIAGFFVFVLSNFDGTKALGYLISLTLLLAMFVNLTVLPALLLWMDKIFTKQATNDPLWEVMNEEEDIDLNQLKLD
jgi:uncharacterized protein